MSDTGARTTATLDALGAFKRLEPAFLRRLDLRDDRRGVVIPYPVLDGKRVRSRVRRFVETAHPTTWLDDGDVQAVYCSPKTIEKARKLGELVIVEGESDCWALWSHGIPALGVPGATMTKLIERQGVERILRIQVAREPDQGGASFVVGVAKRLREIGWSGELLVVDLDAVHGFKDPSALHIDDPERFKERWRNAIEAASPFVEETSTVIEERIVRLVSASTIVPRETEYVWAPYIPRGEVTWIEGVTKSGKTMAALDLIARGSRGESHPLTGEPIRARRAVILTCEDSPDRTIVPRLIAAGCVLDNVSIVRVEDRATGGEQVPSFLRDLNGIAQALREQRADLLLVDGSFGVLGVVDGNDYAEAYRVMLPVVGMTRDLNIGTLALRHVRKSDTHALHRGIGSVGYASLARSTISVAIDRDDDGGQRRLFAHAGSNVGETGPTMAFRINGAAVAGFARPVGRVEWIEVVDGVCADDLDRSRSPEDGADRDVADEWLSSFLVGPLAASDVFAAADRVRISRRTVQRAAKRLGVIVERRGFGLGSVWSPPIRATNTHSRQVFIGGANGANEVEVIL